MQAITLSLIVLSFMTNVFPGEFTAEGMTYELPDGFEEADFSHIADDGGPYFPIYYLNEDEGILVRLRRDTFEDYTPNWDSFLYSNALAYTANSIGHYPEDDEVDIIRMDKEMIEDLGVENGLIATFFLSDVQQELQGISFELLVTLGKGQDMYLISFGFEKIPEGMDETATTAEFMDEFIKSIGF